MKTTPLRDTVSRTGSSDWTSAVRSVAIGEDTVHAATDTGVWSVPLDRDAHPVPHTGIAEPVWALGLSDDETLWFAGPLGLGFVELPGHLSGLENGGLDLVGLELGFTPIALLHFGWKIDWVALWIVGHFLIPS